MASVIKLGQGKSPPRAIDFNNAEGKRQRLRLGIVSSDIAEECCRRIEKLVAAKKTGHTPDLPTLDWLKGLSSDLHVKLAGFGLCESRQPTKATPTLAAWITKFLDQRTKAGLAKGSLQRLRQTGDRMANAFKSTTRLDAITPNMAADWRNEMLSEGLSEATVRLHQNDLR